MSIIKLNATSSTNDYLETLSKNQSLKNYTVVLADEQTNGRGQMGTTWSSEKGKNLIMSVLIKNVMSDIEHIFYLNMAVSLSVVQVLESLKLEYIAIKWPNDIMAENKKIGGILIENTYKSDNKIESIIGIGLNVNQMNFDNLPKASSDALDDGARIVAVADVWAALGAARAHRPAHDRAAAATLLAEEARAGRLDARAVEAALALVGAPASTTPWPARLATPSLSKTWLTWCCTVLALTASRRAISGLVRPIAISRSTSTSRGPTGRCCS